MPSRLQNCMPCRKEIPVKWELTPETYEPICHLAAIFVRDREDSLPDAWHIGYTRCRKSAALHVQVAVHFACIYLPVMR